MLCRAVFVFDNFCDFYFLSGFPEILGQPQRHSRMGLLNVMNIMIIYDFHKNIEIYDVLSIVFHLLFRHCLLWLLLLTYFIF